MPSPAPPALTGLGLTIKIQLVCSTLTICHFYDKRLFYFKDQLPLSQDFKTKYQTYSLLSWTQKYQMLNLECTCWILMVHPVVNTYQLCTACGFRYIIQGLLKGGSKWFHNSEPPAYYICILFTDMMMVSTLAPMVLES